MNDSRNIFQNERTGDSFLTRRINEEVRPKYILHEAIKINSSVQGCLYYQRDERCQSGEQC